MIRLFILAFTVFLAVSCQEKEGLAGSGMNPLDNCVLTQSAYTGMEAVAQWNGFESSAEVFLKGEDGQEYETEVSVITASGLIFMIPERMPAGTYDVILKQTGKIRTLGSIDILVSDTTVTGLEFPSLVEVGEEFVIKGIGFGQAHSLTLVKGDKTIELDIELISSGMKVKVPENVVQDVYSLYLSDASGSSLLTENLVVAVRKTLKSVSKYVPVYENVKYRTSYELEFESGKVSAIIFTAAQVEDGQVVLEEARDRYVLGDDGAFRAEGGESSSLNIDFWYTRDGNGRIMSADVLRFSRSNPDGTMRRFEWVYDGNDRLTNVTYVLDDITRSLQVYFYEGDNLVEANVNAFVYEDDTLKNNPFAADVTIGCEMMSNTDEPFLFFPYLMGEHPSVSASLPSAIMEPTGSMGAYEKKIINFVTDSEGYVTEMSWEAGSNIVRFEYI